MKRFNCAAGVAAAIAATAGAGAVHALDIHLEGTGRACGGRFAMHGAKVAWSTPFSKCMSKSAVLISERADGKLRTSAFDLGKTQKSCRYKFIVVTTPLSPTESLGWSVTGFQNKEDLLNDRRDDALSCYLTQNTNSPITFSQTAAQSR